MTLAALIAAAVVTLAAAQDAPADAWLVLDQEPGPEQTCIVCNQPPLGRDDMMVRYRGREVMVCGKDPCLATWADDRGRAMAFRSVQARTALFDEEAMTGGPIGSGWLWLGLYIFAGTLVGGLCGYLAVGRGLSPLVWFFAGLLLNVVALAGVLTRRRGDITGLPQGIPAGLCKVPRTRAPSHCSDCGDEHHPAAKRCDGCGKTLHPSIEAEIGRV